MLPTKHKDKLPPKFSYPLGSEAVTSMLSGISRYDLISLSFVVSGAARGGSLGNTFQVVRIGHYKNRASYGVGSVTDDWYFNVYAVPSASKKLIGGLLGSSSREAMRQWFELERPQSWYESRNELLIEYGASDGLQFNEI